MTDKNEETSNLIGGVMIGIVIGMFIMTTLNIWGISFG